MLARNADVQVNIHAVCVVYGLYVHTFSHQLELCITCNAIDSFATFGKVTGRICGPGMIRIITGSASFCGLHETCTRAVSFAPAKIHHCGASAKRCILVRVPSWLRCACSVGSVRVCASTYVHSMMHAMRRSFYNV